MLNTGYDCYHTVFRHAAVTTMSSIVLRGNSAVDL